MNQDFIRDEAKALFNKLSFAKTSVSDIAKACGLGKGTIYLYFKSKDDILLAIIEERIARIVAEDDGFYSDASLLLESKVERFFMQVVDETFALKHLVFGAFENLQGRLFTDIFFKYGRYFEWCVDRFADIVRAYEPHASKSAEALREDAKTLVELVIGRMVLFLVARDWDDREGLKAFLAPLSLRLFASLMA
jgi:AcrR family transcriptional regulator